MGNEVQTSKRSVFPFLAVGVLWCVFGVMLCLKLSPATESLVSVKWMLGLAALCLLDLLALAKVLQTAISLMSDGETPESRPAAIVQAMFWGAVKLGCLGLFGMILLSGR